MNDKLCPEKTRLISDLHEATMAYSTAVSALFETMGRADRTDFHALKDAADGAREALAEARRQLKLHSVENHC